MTQKLYLLPVGTIIEGSYMVGFHYYKAVGEYKYSLFINEKLWHVTGQYLLRDTELLSPLGHNLRSLSVQDLM